MDPEPNPFYRLFCTRMPSNPSDGSASSSNQSTRDAGTTTSPFVLVESDNTVLPSNPNPIQSNTNTSTPNTTSTTSNSTQAASRKSKSRPTTEWRHNPNFRHVHDHIKDIERCLGFGKRGNSCNATKKNPSECVCSPEHLPDRKKWSNIYIDPPNPLMSNHHEDSMPFCYTRVYFWIPELFFHRRLRHMPCPHCGDVQGNVITEGWSENVSTKNFGLELFIHTV